MRKSLVRRHSQQSEIPTASTSDVAFLLILFFMVTTVFRATALNLKLTLPQAKSTERIIVRRDLSYLWIDANERVFIDDKIVPADHVASTMSPKVAENENLVTMLNIDQDIGYGVVDVILDQLKEAKAFRITFATEFRS